VDRTGKQIRALSYDYTTEAFTARCLTTVTPNIALNPTSACYLRGFGQTAANYAVFRNANGQLSLLTIDPQQKVLGWSRFQSAATFRSICTVGDTLYAIQDYNGHRYITKLVDGHFLDLIGSASADTATASWGGFTTFANRTITVIGDGYEFQDIAVNGSGAFTLPSSVSQVYVGIPYSAIYESLPFAPAINGQLVRGNRMRKVLADVTVRATRDVWVDGKQVPLRRLGIDNLDDPIPDQNKTFRVSLPPRWATELTITIESRAAQPFQLIGLVVEVDPGV